MDKTIRRIYAYNKRYQKEVVAGLIILVVSRIAQNYTNFFYKDFVQSLSGNSAAGTLLQILIGFLVLSMLANVLDAVGNLINDSYFIKTARDARLDVFSHLHKLDFSFHATKQSGSLISMMKRGDGAFFNINLEINRNLLKLLVDFIFVIIVFWTIDLRIMLITLSIVAFDLLLTVYLTKKNINSRNILNDQDDFLTGIIVDNLMNYETVKFFAKEDRERSRMASRYELWIKAMWDYANTFRLIEISTAFLAVVGSGVIMAIALQQMQNGSLGIGDIVLLLSFIGSFFPRLTDVVYRVREIAKQHADLEKYLSILDLQVEVMEDANPVNLTNVKGEIAFRNVSFHYRERKNVIEGLNLIIKPGESVAFVGESGAGKTTLTKLLLRFYDVDQGAIEIDGHDIRKLSKSSLRTSIGMVPQEPVLFNESIGFNIGYGKDTFTQEQIVAAARIANLDRFISALPQGYETIVGERGIKLSGGQKQRLAIARMFLADPPIIIFDEATSQLDSKSEKLIQEAFWRVASGKTTIIIAHRLSTVMKVNRIIVIDDGKIIEEGTHAELSNKTGGLYKSLWDLQRGEMLI